MWLPYKGRALTITSFAAVGVLVAGGIAWAAIPDSDGVIHGCYAKKGGSVKVIDTDKGATCPTGYLPLDWNQQGIPGIDGEDGQDGAPGAPGIDGEDGQDGAPGAPGIDGEDGQDGAPGPQGSPGSPGSSNFYIVETSFAIDAQSTKRLTLTCKDTNDQIVSANPTGRQSSSVGIGVFGSAYMFANTAASESGPATSGGAIFDFYNNGSTSFSSAAAQIVCLDK